MNVAQELREKHSDINQLYISVENEKYTNELETKTGRIVVFFDNSALDFDFVEETTTLLTLCGHCHRGVATDERGEYDCTECRGDGFKA